MFEPPFRPDPPQSPGLSYVVTVSASQTALVVLFKRAGTEAILSIVAATLFSWHEIEAVTLTQGDDRTADGGQSRAVGGPNRSVAALSTDGAAELVGA